MPHLREAFRRSAYLGKRKRLLFPAAGVLVLVALVATFARRGEKPGEFVVRRGTLEPTVPLVGTLNAARSDSYGAVVPGVELKILALVEEGTLVAAGDRLIQFDPAPFQKERDVARARARELLSSFDLSDAADRLVRTYSGGMRRRLDLAAALVARPPVLFLDEPTTGLDIRSRIELWDAIEALVSEGTTVLLTTQYLDEADRLANRVAVIDQGLVIAEGTPEELKTQVGGERLEIRLCDGQRGEEAVAALVSIASDRPFLEDGCVRVPVAERRGTIADAVRRLDDAGIAIDDISVSTPTLDDVFLNLTGHAAEPETEEAEVQPR